MNLTLGVYIGLVVAAAGLSLAGTFLLLGAGPTLIAAGVEALAASEVIRRGMTALPEPTDGE